MTDTVIIYTQDDCPPCAFIKNYLVNKNIKFTEKNIKNQKYKNEMMDYDALVLTPLNGNLIKTLCSRLLILCILQEISSLVFVEFDYYYSF